MKLLEINDPHGIPLQTFFPPNGFKSLVSSYYAAGRDPRRSVGCCSSRLPEPVAFFCQKRSSALSDSWKPYTGDFLISFVITWLYLQLQHPKRYVLIFKLSTCKGHPTNPKNAVSGESSMTPDYINPM
ncbi:hypothetical protein EVAR_66135_1 [Eumeta japonica]|uniref:Uncharacterized protein n=1 Tax=Eumeta variegata TaxID=151549 RepID=A0A4C1Z0K8_EUMVA|nr:hypothetical protein EVAR_66135_1 [Eumeta japonica]